MSDDDELIEKIISENQNGLERLAREEPAEESRSRLKKIRMKIKAMLRREDKTGRITA